MNCQSGGLRFDASVRSLQRTTASSRNRPATLCSRSYILYLVRHAPDAPSSPRLSTSSVFLSFPPFYSSMAAVAIPLAPLPTPEHSDVEDALSSDIRELEQKRSLAGLHVTDGSHNTNAFHYERQLGDNELSYYLPSRATGVNDMYVSPKLCSILKPCLTILLPWKTPILQVSAHRLQGSGTLLSQGSCSRRVGYHACAPPPPRIEGEHARLR